MADASAIGDLAPLLQAGGVIAFATAVWWELRRQGMRRDATEKEQAARDERMIGAWMAVRETLAVLIARTGRRMSTSPLGVKISQSDSDD